MTEEVLTEALVAEAGAIEAEAEEGPEVGERMRRRNGFPAPSWVVLFSKYGSVSTMKTDVFLISRMCQAYSLTILKVPLLPLLYLSSLAKQRRLESDIDPAFWDVCQSRCAILTNTDTGQDQKPGADLPLFNASQGISDCGAVPGPSLKDEVMKIMPVQKQTRAGQRTRFKVSRLPCRTAHLISHYLNKVSPVVKLKAVFEILNLSHVPSKAIIILSQF